MGDSGVKMRWAGEKGGRKRDKKADEKREMLE